jgi:hypothetical protein
MDLGSKTVLFGRTSGNLLVSHLLWFELSVSLIGIGAARALNPMIAI